MLGVGRQNARTSCDLAQPMQMQAVAQAGLCVAKVTGSKLATVTGEHGLHRRSAATVVWDAASPHVPRKASAAVAAADAMTVRAVPRLLAVGRSQWT